MKVHRIKHEEIQKVHDRLVCDLESIINDFARLLPGSTISLWEHTIKSLKLPSLSPRDKAKELVCALKLQSYRDAKDIYKFMMGHSVLQAGTDVLSEIMENVEERCANEVFKTSKDSMNEQCKKQ